MRFAHEKPPKTADSAEQCAAGNIFWPWKRKTALENRRFRTALGGFHRQDVLDYIENAAREAQELLDESKQACRMLEAESGDLRCSSLRRRRAWPRWRPNATRWLPPARTARFCAQPWTRRITTRRRGEELSRLRKRQDEAEPDAAAYREIRERLAAVGNRRPPPCRRDRAHGRRRSRGAARAAGIASGRGKKCLRRWPDGL